MHKLLEADIGWTHSIELSFEGMVVKSLKYKECHKECILNGLQMLNII
jgi:hypothetical protein